MFIVIYDIGLRLYRLYVLRLCGFVFMKFSCLVAGAMGGGLEDMGTVFTEMGLDPFG